MWTKKWLVIILVLLTVAYCGIAAAAVYLAGQMKLY